MICNRFTSTCNYLYSTEKQKGKCLNTPTHRLLKQQQIIDHQQNKAMRRKLLFLALVCLCPFYISAQSGINSGRGELNGANGSMDYSIGQVFFSEYTQPSLTLTEGIHGYEISTIGDILIEELSLEIALYPNPAIDYFTLSFGNESTLNYTAILTTSEGKHILEWEINAAVTTTEIAHLASGLYLLMVIKENQIMKTFKIVKK